MPMDGRHDTGYALLFSQPRMVQDLLRGFLPEEWIGWLHPRTLERRGRGPPPEPAEDPPDLAPALAGGLGLGLPAAQAAGGARPLHRPASGARSRPALPRPSAPPPGDLRAPARRAPGGALQRRDPLDRAARRPRAVPAAGPRPPAPRPLDPLPGAGRYRQPGPARRRGGQPGLAALRLRAQPHARGGRSPADPPGRAPRGRGRRA